MWWYPVDAAVYLIGLGEAPLDVNGTDSATLTESAVIVQVSYPVLETFTETEGAVTLLALPVGTETGTLADTGAIDATSVGVETFTVTDVVAVDSGSAFALNGVDTGTVDDQPTAMRVEYPNTLEPFAVDDTTAVVDIDYPDSQEIFTLSELADAQLQAATIEASDSATASDASIAQGLAVGVDSASLTDAGAALRDAPVSDTVTLSEVADTVPVVVVASDSATVTDIASLASGGEMLDGDVMLLSEQAVATLACALVDSAAVTDTGLPAGVMAVVEVFTLSELAESGADLTGLALASSMTLRPRLVLTAGAGAATVTIDSTYITADSTLTTLDGGYLGAVPSEPGVRRLLEATVEIS